MNWSEWMDAGLSTEESEEALKAAGIDSEPAKWDEETTQRAERLLVWADIDKRRSNNTMQRGRGRG